MPARRSHPEGLTVFLPETTLPGRDGTRSPAELPVAFGHLEDTCHVLVGRSLVHVDAAYADLRQVSRGIKKPREVALDLVWSTVLDAHRGQADIEERVGEVTAALGEVRAPADIEETGVGHLGVPGCHDLHVGAAVMDAVWLKMFGEETFRAEQERLVDVVGDHLHRAVGVQVDGGIDPGDRAID
jgi:hypothetical protein